jgi:hypothetical protein
LIAPTGPSDGKWPEHGLIAEAAETMNATRDVVALLRQSG